MLLLQHLCTYRLRSSTTLAHWTSWIKNYHETQSIKNNCHKNRGPGCPCCPTSDGSHTNTLVGTNEPFSIPEVGWGQTNGSFWNSLQPQPQRKQAGIINTLHAWHQSPQLRTSRCHPRATKYISVSSFRISNTPLFTSTTLSPPQQKPSIKSTLSIVCMATTFLAVSAHYWSTSINLISFPCFPLWWWKSN